MWPIPQETSLMENLIFLYSDNIYSSKNTPKKLYLSCDFSKRISMSEAKLIILMRNYCYPFRIGLFRKKVVFVKYEDHEASWSNNCLSGVYLTILWDCRLKGSDKLRWLPTIQKCKYKQSFSNLANWWDVEFQYSMFCAQISREKE